MKRRILLSIVLLIVLTACSAQPVPTAAAPASATPVPSATATALPTATATPEPTAIPTATPEPTATPLPDPITAENAGELQLVRRSGEGRMVQTLWSPEADQVLVLTSVHLKAFDPTSGELVWEIETGSPQTMMAYSAEGEIATLSADGAVRLWDAAGGGLIKTALEPGDGNEFGYLPNTGSRVALSSSGRQTTIWDFYSGEILASNDGASHPQGIDAVLLSPDGTTFWTDGFDSNGSQQIQAWDAQSGKFLHGLRGLNLFYLTNLAISPDSTRIAGVTRLALTSEVEYALWVWKSANAELLNKIVIGADVDSYAFLPGGDQVLVASANSFLVADASSGEKGKRFGVYNSTVISLDVSADGTKMAAACADGTVKIFDLAAQKEIGKFKLDLSLTVAPYRIVGANYIVRFERYTGLGVDPGGTFVAKLSPDRKQIQLVDPESLELVQTISTVNAPFSTFAVSPDGSRIVAVDEYNVIMVFNTANGRQISTILADHKNYIKMVELSPDGRLVASLSGGNLGEFYLWDAAGGEKLLTLSGYNAIRFSPDGKTAVSDNVDFGLYLWDVSNGKKLASPSADWILDLDYAPDGKTIATSGFKVRVAVKERENLIAFFDAATYKMLPLKLTGHPSAITEVRYSPDGTLIASADAHGNIRLWDVQSGAMLAEIREAAPGPVQLQFLADGRTLVLGSGDGTLRFFEAR